MPVQLKQKKSPINLKYQESLTLDATYSELIENRAFQFLLHYTSDPVFVINLQKEQITTVNNSVLQKTASDINQWTNKLLAETPLDPSLAGVFQDMMQQLHFEYYIIGQNMKSPWQQNEQLVVDGLNYNGLGIFILKEKTESKLMISDKNKLHEMKVDHEFLQTEKMASIGRLASGIAHELRNPLTIISATAQFSLERLELNPKTKEYFETIYRNVKNANHIVKEMLEYAKPRELSFKLDNINNIILRTIDLIKLEIIKNKIELRTSLDKTVPDFQVDSKHLEQTFLNIILNAIHAIHAEGTIAIKTEFDSENQEITLKIEDNGEGIPLDIQKKIFDPFYTTRSGGTGLGLSICQNIVHAHEGAIEVKSEPGKGATFSITFPVRNLSVTEDPY